MRKFILSILLAVTFALHTNAQQAIIFHSKDGAKKMERLNTIRYITFSPTNKMLIKTVTDGETDFAFDNITNISFGAMITFSVKFSGDSISIAPQAVDYGKYITPPIDPVRAGYDFGGWFTDKGTFVNKWNFATNAVMQDTTLYAKWIQTVGMKNIESTEVKIFPNPVKNELRIEIGELKMIRTDILNLSGKTILQFNKSISKINVSELPEGVYFVKIITDKGIITGKFLKK